jgi:hypothetical protein
MAENFKGPPDKGDSGGSIVVPTKTKVRRPPSSSLQSFVSVVYSRRFREARCGNVSRRDRVYPCPFLGA